MSCGACGMKYRRQAQHEAAFITPVKGSRKGVIKKASTLQSTEVFPSSTEKEGEETSPPSIPNPVDGETGPSSEIE